MKDTDLNKLALDITEHLFDTDSADEDASVAAIALTISKLKPLFMRVEAAERDRDAAIAGHRRHAATLIADRGALRERAEAAEAELARRDAAEGEPVGWQYRVSAGPQTGWSLWGLGDGREYEKSYRAERRRIYAAAQPAALPPDLETNDTGSLALYRGEMMASPYWIAGYRQCREDAKALGFQPVPVVKLSGLCVGVVQGGNAVMVPYAGGHWLNKTAVLEALDAAGIKWEVEHETSD